MMKPCLKCTVVFSSVLVTIAGGLLAAVGVVVKYRTEMLNGYLTPVVKLLSSGGGTETDVWTLYNMAAIASIVCGSATVITGFLGCWVGAYTRMLPIICFMLFSTIVVCCLTTSAALILTTDIQVGMADTLRANLVNHYRGDESKTEFSEAWNYAFVEFSCCGAMSYIDFKLAVQWDRQKTDDNGTIYTVEVPVTCCKLPGKYPDFGTPYNESCTTDPSNGNSYFSESCPGKLYDYLWYYGILLSCSCLGDAGILGIALAVVTAICVELKKKRKRVKQALVSNTP